MAASSFPPSPAFSPARPPASKTKWIVLGVLLVVVLIIALWSCGKGAYHDYRVSSAAVERFHHRLDSGDFEAIYGDASDGFRSAGAREEQVKFLQTVHQKLGNSGKTTAQGFHANWQNSHVFVNQVFETQFAQGAAREEFVWLIESGNPRLYGYHVDLPNDLH